MKLPQNIDAERMVIGSAIYDSERYRHDINGEHFTTEAHRTIYRAIGELIKSGASIDFVTLIAKLNEMGARAGAEQVSAAYITELTDCALAAQGGVNAHVDILKELAARRAVMRSAHTAMLAASDPEKPIEDVVAMSRRVGSAANTEDGKLVCISEATDAYLAELDVRTKASDEYGISTGLRALDNVQIKLYPSDLFVVGGRPGMGKTAFAVNNLVMAAAWAGKRVYVQSLEMSTGQLIERMLAALTGISNKKMLAADLGSNEWSQIASKSGELAGLGIHINDKARVSSGYVRAQAEMVLQQHGGIDLVVVDYIQRMREPGKWYGRRHEEVGEICQNLKAMAKELEIPVVAISQLNRGTERGRRGAKPTMSDLKESGDIEQEADTILLIHRPEYYAEGAEKEELKGVGKILVEKNRKGPAGGEYRVAWIADQTRFADLALGY